MYLENYYYYFTKAFNNEFCDSIQKIVKDKTFEKGVVSKGKNEIKDSPFEFKTNLTLRDSDICWINDQWIYDCIQPFLHEANKMANWNYQVDSYEDLQFTRYKENQHYDWHFDNLGTPFNTPDDPMTNGKYRKISFSINLSDPKNYEGGKLCFDYPVAARSNKIVECEQLKEKGSVVFFPSFMKHKVTPVTKGERNSLVGWCLGYPFV
jgi:PKHD-type hydroxylase